MNALVLGTRDERFEVRRDGNVAVVTTSAVGQFGNRIEIHSNLDLPAIELTIEMLNAIRDTIRRESLVTPR